MSPVSYVYFIRPIGLPGPIKIGASNSPRTRLVSLGRWSPFPLEVALTVPGRFDLEYRFHWLFASAHSHCEWFHPTAPLLKTIERLRSGEPLGSVIDLITKPPRRIQKNKAFVEKNYILTGAHDFAECAS